MHNLITITSATLHDLEELRELFAETIITTCAADYNPQQLHAWASSSRNTERWQKLITNQYVRVARINNQITGFGSLDGGTHIDMLFVHNSFQRRGIAGWLLTELEHKAKRLNALFLTADVSKTARLFFEKQGFNTLAEQKPVRNGVELVNYKMRKDLLADQL